MEFYSGIIRDSSNSQTLFNTVSRLLRRNMPVDYPSTCESDTALANKFIGFFGDKITVIRNALDEVLDSILGSDDNVSFSDQFTLSSFRSVTSSDIWQLISRSNIKSCPLDPVPAWVLKQCISVLLTVISRIINRGLLGSLWYQNVLNLQCWILSWRSPTLILRFLLIFVLFQISRLCLNSRSSVSVDLACHRQLFRWDHAVSLQRFP